MHCDTLFGILSLWIIVFYFNLIRIYFNCWLYPRFYYIFNTSMLTEFFSGDFDGELTDV